MTQIFKVYTISFIIISVGPMFLCTRNAFKDLKNMKIRDKAYIRLGILNVTSLANSRSISAAIRKTYDNKSATFQKFCRYLFKRDNRLR